MPGNRPSPPWLAWGTLAACAVAWAGCDLILPYGKTRVDAAPTLEDGPRDGVQDVDVSSDPRDGGPDGCHENQALPASKAQCTGACTGTGDCDGLPLARDPYPAQCNRLLFEETFGAVPGGWDLHSTGAGLGGWNWSCGWLEQRLVTGSHTARAPGALKHGDYLVEARVTLGKQAGASGDTDWRVGIRGRWSGTTPGAYLECGVWVYHKQQTRKPDLYLLSRASGKPAIEAWPWVYVKTFDSSPGQTYYLQLWFTPDITRLEKPLGLVRSPGCDVSTQGTNCPAVMCRLCNETTCVRTAWYGVYKDPGTFMSYVATGPGTVGLVARSRAARFDYVRAFELTHIANP